MSHFAPILQPRKFCKVEVTDISSASKTAKKITKPLQSFNYNLNHLNLSSTLVAMSLQKWELFPGSSCTWS